MKIVRTLIISDKYICIKKSFPIKIFFELFFTKSSFIKYLILILQQIDTHKIYKYIFENILNIISSIKSNNPFLQ